MCVDNEWEAAVVGQADVGIHADIVAVDTHLSAEQCDTSLPLAFGHAHNVAHSPSCIIYPLMVKSSQVCSTRAVAPFGYACLSIQASQALVLFRLGCAPLSRNTAFGTNMLSRVCIFCQQYRGLRLIEDEYHVCFDCPLYDQPRYLLFCKLFETNFSFGENVMQNCQPLHLLASILSATTPQHVRLISRFLSDCLAMRALARCDIAEGPEIRGLAAGRWTTHLSNVEKSRLYKHIGDAINSVHVPIRELFSNCFGLHLPPPVPLLSFVTKQTTSG